jgi:hypothetical protein
LEASLGERVYLAEQDPDTRKLIYPDLAPIGAMVTKSEESSQKPVILLGAQVLLAKALSKGIHEHLHPCLIWGRSEVAYFETLGDITGLPA